MACMKIIWVILVFLAGFLLAAIWFSTTSISALNFVTANPDAAAIAFTGTGQDMLFHEFESMVGWFKGTKKPKRRYLIGQGIK
jgi:hypothetical protein